MALVKKETGTRFYQLYNGSWEKLPIFKDWLSPVPDNKHKAYCKFCKQQFRAHRTDLRTHARSRKHQKAGDAYLGETERSTKVVKTETTSPNTKNDNKDDVNSSDTCDEGETTPVKVCEAPSAVKTIACMQLMVADSKCTSTDASGGVSTQVLDLVRGVPVSRLAVTLWFECENTWLRISEGITDADGRCSNLLKANDTVAGRYKMHFEVKKYFTLGLHDTFYPFIEVTFDILDPGEHYHVPLLLSPFGYMVYRGR